VWILFFHNVVLTLCSAGRKLRPEMFEAYSALAFSLGNLAKRIGNLQTKTAQIGPC